jgi:hypothetical protein
MTTSGSVDFSMNRDEIITAALENIGMHATGETIAAEDIVFCSKRLNMMVKAWMAQGIHLWAMKEATLFLSVGTQSYSLGATGTHCTDTYVHTTLTADAASNATSIAITSASGMSASDNIGIVLDDGTIHWTTISGTPGTTTTIASGIASAASSGAVVFAYTTKINRPQRIQSAYRRDISNADIPVRMISREEYADLSNKLSSGKVIQAYYDPQLTNGVLHVWPAPDIATDVVRFWYERILEDFDAVTDTPDFPIEWAEALVASLSHRIAPSYGVSLQERQLLLQDAQMKLDVALDYDREITPVLFQPDLSMR